MKELKEIGGLRNKYIPGKTKERSILRNEYISGASFKLSGSSPKRENQAFHIPKLTKLIMKRIS